MAHSLSAKKRIRQNVKRRARNRARKSALKSDIRRFNDAVHDGKTEEAQQMLRTVVKHIDKVVAKGTLHRNTGSRAKSRLARRLNKLQASA